MPVPLVQSPDLALEEKVMSAHCVRDGMSVRGQEDVGDNSATYIVQPSVRVPVGRNLNGSIGTIFNICR